ncbi:MAG: protein kinase [Planctomycetes bacterium]|nr:protein kinase [Planctomycetota bacterium]
MGVVHAARHPHLGEVALKVLAPDLLDRAALERLRREVQALVRLDHPHVARLLDVGLDGPRPYIAMVRVDGESLAARLRRGPLPVDEAARIAAALAAALEHAHGRGVLHRDVKPANVLLERATCRPVLIDFGLSRVALAGPLTVTGEVVGTPAFMAPEQATGDPAAPLGPATDVYGLGATLHAMLTGAPPFAGATALAVLAKVLEEPPPPASRARPGLDPALERLVLECLAKDPGARPTPGVLAARLARWAAPPRRARRRRPRLAVLVTTLALGATVVAAGAVVVAWPAPPATAAPPPVDDPPAPPAPEAAPAPAPLTVPAVDEETSALLAEYEAAPTPALAVALGQRLYAARRFAEAVGLLEQAVASGEVDWRARFALAGTLRGLRRDEEALAQYRLARTDPFYAGFFAHLREAEALLDLGRAGEAFALLVEALEGPDGERARADAQVLAALAQAAVLTGDPGLGLDLAERSLAGRPDWPRARLARAEALVALGRTEEARPLALELAREAAAFPGVQRLIDALGLPHPR